MTNSISCRVTEVLDHRTIKVTPCWHWESRTGDMVLVEGMPDFPEAQKALKSVVAGEEVELTHFKGFFGGALRCDALIEGQHIGRFIRSL